MWTDGQRHGEATLGSFLQIFPVITPRETFLSKITKIK
jgi:hypothetical protein